MKKAIPIILLMLIGLVLLVACANVSNETVNDTVTIANLKSEVKSAFDRLTIASDLLIDSERGVISFTVENDQSEIALSEIKPLSGSFTVTSSNGNALSVLTLNEGDNTYSLSVTSGTITVTYALKITRKPTTSTDPVIDSEHTHTYADTWSKNEKYHWHAATCEHTNEDKDKAEHAWDEGTVTTLPTEEAEGIKTYTCVVCGAVRIETLDVIGHIHTYSSDWSKDENYHWHAASCDHTDLVQDKGMHTWDDGTITLLPTEEYEGIRIIVCLVCGYSKSEKINRLSHMHTISSEWSNDAYYHWHEASCGKTEHIENKATHIWDEGVVKQKATEEENGLIQYYCTVCGYNKTEIVEKLPHTHKYELDWSFDENYHWHTATCGHDVVINKATHAWGEGSVIKEATEDEPGLISFTCLICGRIKEVGISQLPHTHKYSSDWSYDANCHWHAAICEHTDQVNQKATHTWDAGTITKAPTEKTAGIMTYLCVVCNKERNEYIAPLVHIHTFDNDNWTTDNNYHWHAATCEHTDEVIDKEAHNWVDENILVVATEEIEGQKLQKCSVCEETRTVSMGYLEHVHTYSNDWSWDENYHWYAATCDHMGETKDKALHDWGEWETITPSTEETVGVKVRVCNVCGKEQKENLPTLPHAFDMDHWGYDDYFHWHPATCGHDVVFDKREHDWSDPVDVRASTVYEEGTIEYVCNVCGKTKSEVIPVIPYYTIEFWSNLQKINEQRVAKGDSFQTSYKPETLEDYLFIGWSYANYNAADDVYYLSSNDIVSNAKNDVIILTASFAKIYIVSYEDYDGIPIDSEMLIVPTGEVAYANCFTPTKPGFVFDAWFYNDEIFDCSSPIESDIVLVAHYKKTFQVTFFDYNGDYLYEETVVEGESAIFVTPEREGYTFCGWSESIDHIMQDKSVTAQYMINMYRVSFKVKGRTLQFLDENGISRDYQLIPYLGSAMEPVLDEDDKYYLDWDTFEGFSFSGWHGDYSYVKSDLEIIALYENHIDDPIVAVYTDPFKDLSSSEAQRKTVGFYLFNATTIYGFNVSVKYDGALNAIAYDILPNTAVEGNKDVVKSKYGNIEDLTDYSTDDIEYYYDFTWSSGTPLQIKNGNKKEILAIEFAIPQLMDIGHYDIVILSNTYVVDQNLKKIAPIMVSDYIAIVRYQ